MPQLDPSVDIVTLAEFEHLGDWLAVDCTTYPNGRAAILLSTRGRAYCRWSVNLPEVPLAPGEFFAKTYDENAELREPLLATELFEVCRTTAGTQFVEYELWRLRPEAFEAAKHLLLPN